MNNRTKVSASNVKSHSRVSFPRGSPKQYYVSEFGADDYVKLNSILEKANNSQLRSILEIVEREIRLSETAIKEGMEKRK